MSQITAVLRTQKKKRAVSTMQLWGKLRSLIEEHGPLTVRGVYYRMLSEAGAATLYKVVKGDKGYNKVKAAVTDMRSEGFINSDLIIDPSRRVLETTRYVDSFDYFSSMVKSYRSDWWNDNPDYIEVWTEKEAVVPMIQGAAHLRQVTVRPFKGYPSLTYLQEIADRIAAKNDLGKNVVVYYFGDCDPAGHDIVRDIEERLNNLWHLKFTLVHAGILDEHVTRYGLLTHTVDAKHRKAGQRKWTQYRGVHGDKTQAVEIDAILPKDLIERHMPREEMERNHFIDEGVRELLSNRANMHSTALDMARIGEDL